MSDQAVTVAKHKLLGYFVQVLVADIAASPTHSTLTQSWKSVLTEMEKGLDSFELRFTDAFIHSRKLAEIILNDILGVKDVKNRLTLGQKIEFVRQNASGTRTLELVESLDFIRKHGNSASHRGAPLFDLSTVLDLLCHLRILFSCLSSSLSIDTSQLESFISAGNAVPPDVPNADAYSAVGAEIIYSGPTSLNTSVEDNKSSQKFVTSPVIFFNSKGCANSLKSACNSDQIFRKVVTRIIAEVMRRGSLDLNVIRNIKFISEAIEKGQFSNDLSEIYELVSVCFKFQVKYLSEWEHGNNNDLYSTADYPAFTLLYDPLKQLIPKQKAYKRAIFHMFKIITNSTPCHISLHELMYLASLSHISNAAVLQSLETWFKVDIQRPSEEEKDSGTAVGNCAITPPETMETSFPGICVVKATHIHGAEGKTDIARNESPIVKVREVSQSNEKMDQARSNSEDPLKLAFPDKKYRSLMFAIHNQLKTSEGYCLKLENVKTLAIVKRAISDGRLSDSLDEFRASKKMWFKVIVQDGEEYLAPKDSKQFTPPNLG
jgi:hypothetical protein